MLTKLEIEDIRKKLISVQLGLCSNNNVIATDDLSAKEDETHWRTNHTKQIKEINDIAELLGINLCSDPQYTCDSKCLSMEPPSAH
ncbi:hypothetical protein [Acinetobacter sp. AG1]|uniref:hypothetical protein n=1 Tax=Acinetobacter sp. AG1 TaxID=348388 RepID=UPI000A51C120|nr:hypothetical protein [Acinetobacter sp. AG1]